MIFHTLSCTNGKDKNQGITYKRGEINEFICSYRSFEKMFFLAFTYKQSEFFEVIRNLDLMKSIILLEITDKRLEINPLICNYPLSCDAFELQFTYKQGENKVLICNPLFSENEPSQKLRITIL